MFGTSLTFLLCILPLVLTDGVEYNIDPMSEHGRAHLEEELSDGPVNKKVEEMNSEELQFHYFRQHDFDHNDKLDGTELMMSLSHHQRESGTNSRAFNDDQLVGIVDEILKRHDKDQDGMMTFEEYVAPLKDVQKETPNL